MLELDTYRLMATLGLGCGESPQGEGNPDGGVDVDGEGRDLDFYMLREGDRWTVRAVAYELVDHTDMPWRCY